MKLKTHLEIARRALDKNKDTKYRVYKAVYLIGSIAPDINVVFPKHCIQFTLKRLSKRLKLIDKTSSNLIKSFFVGVVTHYICDYFCYVHNIKYNGSKHITYEKLVAKKVRDLRDTVYDLDIDIMDRIEEALIEINKRYIKESNLVGGIDWWLDEKRVLIDIKYANKMCEKVVNILVC